MTLARVYGRSLGHGSLAVVMRGFESALREQGALKGSYAIDLAAGYADGESPTDGADARHGIFVGPLNAVGQMFERGRHAHHFIMVTPNTDKLPYDLMKKLLGYQEKHSVEFMAPSAWAARIVRSYLGKCITVPHGASPEYHPYPDLTGDILDLYAKGLFRVIHFSSSDRQRKGTIELLQAWEDLKQGLWSTSGDSARLLCVMDYSARAALEEAIADGAIDDWKDLRESVTLMDRAELPPAGMARTLCRSHLVCQPSRGEGFGLIPLEALCSGVPVAATTVTGHSEFLRDDLPGFEGIRTGALTPIDDLPGSLAPSLNPSEIKLALQRARGDWKTLWMWAQSGSSSWRAHWQWSSALESFIEMLKNT